MTRKEHMQFCKARATEYVDRGDLSGAVASMLSDLGKHPDTAPLVSGPLGMIGLMEAASGSTARVQRFIDGFAE